MTPDNIPPEIGWPLAGVLWLVVIALEVLDIRVRMRTAPNRERELSPGPDQET